MRVPEEYYKVFEEYDEEAPLELLKPIYGLVQAARQILEKMIFILTNKLNCKAGKVDTCLLTRTDEDGTVMVILCVDNFLCVGDN